MTAFDRQKVIKGAATEMCERGHPTYLFPPCSLCRRGARYALPVIVAAALEPIREQHCAPHWCMDDEGRSDCYHPDGPGMPWPCPTARLCDEIESSAKGG